jgi:peptidoglycan/LPS O-acetylase OafA/YrhL
VVTCAASWYWQNSVRALATMHDAVWAAFFAANVHFAQIGADYFARDNRPSPLQHFWTLAVEEQFYLAWPLLLTLALAVLARGRNRVDAVVLRRLSVLVAAGVIASLAWSVHQTSADPNGAYFSTPARPRVGARDRRADRGQRPAPGANQRLAAGAALVAGAGGYPAGGGDLRRRHAVSWRRGAPASAGSGAGHPRRPPAGPSARRGRAAAPAAVPADG